MKGRKAWGLLAYLVLTPEAASREQLAGLLFSSAADPLGTVRWNLAELRRALHLPTALKGSQVRLDLPPGTFVDVNVLTSGTWSEGIALPGLGRELLEGVSFASEPAFETWLMVERARLTSAAASVLHEAAAAHLGTNRPEVGARFAARLVAVDPYDEGGHELLIRCYAAAGQHDRAREALQQCIELFKRDLETEPGPGIRSALDAQRSSRTGRASPSPASARAQLELGEAAIKAGAVDTGLENLRAAVAIAAEVGEESLEAEALIALGYALVHAVRGRDGEASALLHRALAIAEGNGRTDIQAAACRELGYIEMLVARYDRALGWLQRALDLAGHDEVQGRAWTLAYQAICYSDTGRYAEASSRIDRCLDAAPESEIPNQAAYALCVMGRIRLLRGDLEGARTCLNRSLDLAQRHGWSSIVPWPESLLADVEVLEGQDPAPRLERALSLAQRMGDPCWEGAALRGLGVVAASRDDVDQAVDTLLEARRQCVRFPDGYLWMQAYALDALCDIGSREKLQDTKRWIHDLETLSARTGMREFLVRAQVYRARMGDPGAAAAAFSLVAEVDNPALVAQVEKIFPD